MNDLTPPMSPSLQPELGQQQQVAIVSAASSQDSQDDEKSISSSSSSSSSSLKVDDVVPLNILQHFGVQANKVESEKMPIRFSTLSPVTAMAALQYLKEEEEEKKRRNTLVNNPSLQVPLQKEEEEETKRKNTLQYPFQKQLGSGEALVDEETFHQAEEDKIRRSTLLNPLQLLKQEEASAAEAALYRQKEEENQRRDTVVNPFQQQPLREEEAAAGEAIQEMFLPEISLEAAIAALKYLNEEGEKMRNREPQEEKKQETTIMFAGGSSSSIDMDRSTPIMKNAAALPVSSRRRRGTVMIDPQKLQPELPYTATATSNISVNDKHDEEEISEPPVVKNAHALPFSSRRRRGTVNVDLKKLDLEDVASATATSNLSVNNEHDEEIIDSSEGGSAIADLINFNNTTDDDEEITVPPGSLNGDFEDISVLAGSFDNDSAPASPVKDRGLLDSPQKKRDQDTDTATLSSSVKSSKSAKSSKSKKSYLPKRQPFSLQMYSRALAQMVSSNDSTDSDEKKKSKKKKKKKKMQNDDDSLDEYEEDMEPSEQEDILHNMSIISESKGSGDFFMDKDESSKNSMEDAEVGSIISTPSFRNSTRAKFQPLGDKTQKARRRRNQRNHTGRRGALDKNFSTTDLVGQKVMTVEPEDKEKRKDLESILTNDAYSLLYTGTLLFAVTSPLVANGGGSTLTTSAFFFSPLLCKAEWCSLTAIFAGLTITLQGGMLILTLIDLLDPTL